MSHRTTVVVSLCALTALGVAGACSNNSGQPGPDGGSGSSSSSSSGSSSSGAPSDGSSGSADAGPGLLVDNMTATTGTQISLQVPSGDTPGTYYAYGDPASVFTATRMLADTPVMPDAGIPNPDGTTIVGDLCFSGSVFQYAGLGMNLVYAPNPNADAGALSMPVPFDASAYHGASFYVLFQASDAMSPTLHFSIPDTQTADPAAFPGSACNFDGGTCDDDFGSDVTFTPGVWTKVSFKFSELTQVGFGTPFNAIMSNKLIGMKWQVNGPQGLDLEPFQFCISDIYFTP